MRQRLMQAAGSTDRGGAHASPPRGGQNPQRRPALDEGAPATYGRRYKLLTEVRDSTVS